MTFDTNYVPSSATNFPILKQYKKQYNTCLRSVLREKLDYTDFFKNITKEQEWITRCFAQLSNTTKVLTDSIVQQNIFDFKKTVENFNFGTYNNNASPTLIQVSSISKQKDFPKLDLVYSFAHFSNLLSEGQDLKALREMITRTGTTTKQNVVAFMGVITNELREYFTNTKNFWGRKRHNCDLQVLSTLLLRATLAP
ncbi:hypothetical protein BDC45DRAFT_593259 [Circinella umbellata]|nr:hypothetical protein BDC45DRAFT_593259 [Circinella umbellata]